MFVKRKINWSIFIAVCHLLGMYFDVIKQNTEKAKKVYKVNCDTYNWSHSCYKYAYLIDKDKKPEKVDEVLLQFVLIN